MPKLHGRRLPCQIMYELLRLAARGEGKTRMMYGANISYALLKRYLAFLQDRGFLVAKEGGYQVTEKGHQFMNDLGRLLKHFKEDEDIPSLPF